MVVDGSRLFRLDVGQLGKEAWEAVELLNRGLMLFCCAFFSFFLPRYVCIPYKDPKCYSVSKYANTIWKSICRGVWGRLALCSMVADTCVVIPGCVWAGGTIVVVFLKTTMVERTCRCLKRCCGWKGKKKEGRRGPVCVFITHDCFLFFLLVAPVGKNVKSTKVWNLWITN
jgi:hypothetical protein